MPAMNVNQPNSLCSDSSSGHRKLRATKKKQRPSPQIVDEDRWDLSPVSSPKFVHPGSGFNALLPPSLLPPPSGSEWEEDDEETVDLFDEDTSDEEPSTKRQEKHKKLEENLRSSMQELYRRRHLRDDDGDDSESSGSEGLGCLSMHELTRKPRHKQSTIDEDDDNFTELMHSSMPDLGKTTRRRRRLSDTRRRPTARKTPTSPQDVLQENLDLFSLLLSIPEKDTTQEEKEPKSRTSTQRRTSRKTRETRKHREGNDNLSHERRSKHRDALHSSSHKPHPSSPRERKSHKDPLSVSAHDFGRPPKSEEPPKSKEELIAVLSESMPEMGHGNLTPEEAQKKKEHLEAWLRANLPDEKNPQEKATKAPSDHPTTGRSSRDAAKHSADGQTSKEDTDNDVLPEQEPKTKEELIALLSESMQELGQDKLAPEEVQRKKEHLEAWLRNNLPDEDPPGPANKAPVNPHPAQPASRSSRQAVAREAVRHVTDASNEKKIDEARDEATKSANDSGGSAGSRSKNKKTSRRSSHKKDDSRKSESVRRHRNHPKSEGDLLLTKDELIGKLSLLVTELESEREEEASQKFSMEEWLHEKLLDDGSIPRGSISSRNKRHPTTSSRRKKKDEIATVVTEPTTDRRRRNKSFSLDKASSARSLFTRLSTSQRRGRSHKNLATDLSFPSSSKPTKNRRSSSLPRSLATPIGSPHRRSASMERSSKPLEASLMAVAVKADSESEEDWPSPTPKAKKGIRRLSLGLGILQNKDKSKYKKVSTNKSVTSHTHSTFSFPTVVSTEWTSPGR